MRRGKRRAPKLSGIDDSNVSACPFQETAALCYIFIQASHPLQLGDILPARYSLDKRPINKWKSSYFSKMGITYFSHAGCTHSHKQVAQAIRCPGSVP